MKLYLKIGKPDTLGNQIITNAEIIFESYLNMQSGKLALAKTSVPLPLPSDYNGENDKTPHEIKKLTYGYKDIKLNTGTFAAEDSINYVLSYQEEVEQQSIYKYIEIRQIAVAIHYKTHYGTVSDWDYNSHDAGRAGTGCVNLLNGNLVFKHDDISSSGNRMPIQISHYYNAARADSRHVLNSFSKDCDCEAGMDLGKGWKLNIQESIMPIDRTKIHVSEDYQYIYCDDSGAEVFLKKKKKEVKVYENGEVKKENGQEVTKLIPVKINDVFENNEPSNFYYEDVTGCGYEWNPATRILSKNGLKYKFNLLGLLYEVEDSYGNTQQIVYNRKKQIVKVIDGAGREFEFAYDTQNRLTRIKGPLKVDNLFDCVMISFFYENGQLVKIVYPDGNFTKFSYGAALTKASNVIGENGSETEGYAIAYTYNGLQVSSVTEKSGYVEGRKTTYDYDTVQRKTTAVSFYEKDGQFPGQTATGEITTTYVFDESGKTISTYLNTPEVQNVSAGGYLSGVNPYIGGVNYTANVINLLQNHNFEAPNTVWRSFINKPAGNEALFQSITDEEKFFGTKSAKIQNVNNQIKGIYQRVANLPAGYYTLSAYVKTKGIGAVPDMDSGAFVSAYSIDGDIIEKLIDRTSEFITDTQGEFRRIQVSFYKYSVGDITLMLGIKNAAGTAYFDGVQLEPGEACNDYNMLENGNFENSLTGWKGNQNLYGILDTPGVSFSMKHCAWLNCRSIDSEQDDYNYRNYNGQMWQTVPVNSEKTTLETFVFGGWVKSEGPFEEANENRKFELRAVIQYPKVLKADGTVELPADSESFSAPIAPYNEGWQFVSVSFAKTKFRPVSCVEVYADIENNVGSLYLDCLQLTRTDVQTIDETYFKPLEEISATESNEDVRTEPSENIDFYGNTLYTVSSLDGAPGAFYESSIYTDDGNYLAAEMDNRGNLTQYTVDVMSGLTHAVQKPGQSKEYYLYDRNQRLAGVRTNPDPALQNGQPDPSDISVTYEYDYLDKLTRINHNGFDYRVRYTPFGSLESIGIADENPLVSYHYRGRNGRLKKITYANGHTMECKYDGLGRLVEEQWFDAVQNGNLTAHYNYVYDGAGNVIKSIDNLAKIEYNYYYEGGRIVRSSEYSFSLMGLGDPIALRASKTFRASQEYRYKGGQLAWVIENRGGEVNEYSFREAAGGNGKSVTLAGEFTSHTLTDAHDRPEYRQIKTADNFLIGTRYKYLQGYADKEVFGKIVQRPETNLVSQIVYGDDETSARTQTLDYTYDSAGRIASVSRNGSLQAKYTYDGLGRLIREDNADFRKSTTFVYDAGGNILEKREYPFTTAGLQEMSETECTSYTYDSVWRDKLVSMTTVKSGAQTPQTETLTYDDSGNPLSYRGYTMTWEKGRQLKTLSLTGNHLSFDYNANGVRTGKNTGGVQTDYTVNGAKILWETKSAYSLKYLYDESCSVIGVTYKRNADAAGKSFFYKKNLQGDVIAILDSLGRTVGTYSYDAWGKVTAQQCVMGDWRCKCSGYGYGYSPEDCECSEYRVDDRDRQIVYINPIRYRGYYYDTETKLYYLNSRYYDPATGRFLNADSTDYLDPETVGGCNLFAYCNNDPVNSVDHEGKRTYFLNGINNNKPYANDVPGYAWNFCMELESRGVVNVMPIGLFQGGLIIGVLGFAGEKSNRSNAQTEYAMARIDADLANHPLERGETINVIGYSGGGIVALKVLAIMEARRQWIANVITIGAPLPSVIKSQNAKISVIYGKKDTIGKFKKDFDYGWLKSYNIGKFKHTDYFKSKKRRKNDSETFLTQTANLVAGIILGRK